MKKAFTLIELLVVIAIIAILAAILFPVFAQAKQAAKKTQDLSNVKQLSLGITLYTSDHDDMYPSAYFHRAFNPALGGTTAGYVHWSGMVEPYVKNRALYISPGDKIAGHAPTCFTDFDNNSGGGIPSNQAPNRCTASRPDLVPANFIRNGFVVDQQVPRISYTVNSAFIGRYRNIGDVMRGISITSQTQIDNVSNNILLAGFVDNVSCLSSASITSVVRSASHRSTNAYSIDQANTRAYFGSQEDGASRPAQVWALAQSQITSSSNNIFQLCSTTPRTDYPLAVYHSWNRWNEGDNYGMADGSAKFAKFSKTIDPANYLWGSRIMTDGGMPVLNPLTGLPVTN
jgi:prepilin-type N-terminal cleavage/methylation domain-containing protein